MPLPAALAARLQKRGILSQPEKKPEIGKVLALLPKISLNYALNLCVIAEHHEEVIAEDYDDPSKLSGYDGKPGAPVTGCPNKWNVYHDCSSYCVKRWGNGKPDPSPTTRRKYQKLLKRFPLTDGWQDVYDPGV